MGKNKKQLSELKLGQSGIIEKIENEAIVSTLMEMGCLPGEKVTLTLVAPLGDPIAIDISGYTLSLRKQDASSIQVRVID